MAYFLFKCWHERLFKIHRKNIIPHYKQELEMVPVTEENVFLVKELRGDIYEEQFLYQLSMGDFGYYAYIDGKPVGYGWAKHEGSDDYFFEARLGAGASSLNSCLLLFIPALIVVCGIFLSTKESRKNMTMKNMLDDITEGMLKVVPTAALVLFAYFVSNVFEDLNVEVAIGQFISSLNMSKLALVILIPLFTAILGMLLPGSTQVKIFGGIIISILAASGVNPMLAAAMLPCICGAMYGVTPPYCACVYTGMGIAQSELGPTLKNCMIWVLLHYVLSVIIMLEWLPIWGLIG